MKICFSILLILMFISAVFGNDNLVFKKEIINNTPVMFVNGKPEVPAIFLPNIDNEPNLVEGLWNDVKTAGTHGIKYVYIPVAGGPYGERDKLEEKCFDERISRAVKENPNAKLILRLGYWPPKWWKDENSDDATKHYDGTIGTGSIHSKKWKDDCNYATKVLIEYCEKKWGKYILGYHPCGLYSAEWFAEGYWEGESVGYEKAALNAFKAYAKKKYKNTSNLQRAWNDKNVNFENITLPTYEERYNSTFDNFRSPELEQKTIDFCELVNIDTANSPIEICKTIKKYAPNKLTIVFYGYIHELAGGSKGVQWSGHLNIRDILNSPYVDAVSSPYSYGNRAAGGVVSYMTPVDSILKAGKMFIFEDDTRTYLNGPDNPLAVKDMRETKGVLSRDYATQLVRNQSNWWFDICSIGAFRGDEIWGLLGGITDDLRKYYNKPKEYKPEIAVVVDPESIMYTSTDPNMNSVLLDYFRRSYYKIGAPIGFYLLDDVLSGKVDYAKMYIFLNVHKADSKLIDTLHERTKGKTSLWMYGSGIIDGKTISLNNMEKLTTIKLAKRTGDSDIILRDTKKAVNNDIAKLYSNKKLVTSDIKIVDDNIYPLGFYRDNYDVAIAKKVTGDTVNIYANSPILPTDFLRDVAKSAGVFIYNDTNDYIMAGNNYVAIHATSSGSKEIKFKKKTSIYDIISNERYEDIDHIDFNMQIGDTKIFRVIK